MLSRCKGLSINDVIFFVDFHSLEYTLFYPVQVYKKDNIIYDQPLSRHEIGMPTQRSGTGRLISLDS